MPRPSAQLLEGAIVELRERIGVRIRAAGRAVEGPFGITELAGY